MLRRVLITMSFSIMVGALHAQDLELANVGYSWFPKVATQEGNTDEEIGFREFSLLMNVPIILKKSQIIIIHGLNYRYVTPEASTRDVEKELYYIGYSFSLLKNLSNHWRLLTTFNPAISSDLEKRVSAEDILYQGSFLFTKKANEVFSWGTGGAYLSRFGVPLAMPLLQLKWAKRNFTLDVLLPAYLRIAWDVDKSFSYGLRISVNGSQYNINSLLTRIPVESVHFSRVKLEPQIEYHVSQSILLWVSAGMAVGRTFNFDMENIDDRDFSLNNGTFASIGLKIVPNREK